MTTRQKLSPAPAAHGGGNRREPPVRTCCGAGDPDPNWLSNFLADQFGSAADLHLALGVATREVTFVELGKRLVVDRRTAREWWLRLLAQVRQGWFSRLSATLLTEFHRAGRAAAIKPFTLRTVAVPATVRVLAVCDRPFAGHPSIAELCAFCEDVYPSLFGRHGAVLTLCREASGNTNAAVVVPAGIGNAAARHLDDDRFGLAA